MIVLHVLGNESVIRILILPWVRVVDGAPIGAWQLQPANSTTGDPWAGVCRIALVDHDNPHKEVRFAEDTPLEEAVLSELVSEAKFPASWENTGNSVRLDLRVRLLARNPVTNSMIYGPIPYASEQGIYFGLAGN